MTLKSPVAIAKCASYSPAELDAAISRVLELIEIEESGDLAGKRVLLKINHLNGTAPEASANTHIEFTRAVIRHLKSRGIALFVSDSAGPLEDTLGCFKRSGYSQMCDEEGVELVPLSRDGYERIDLPDGRQIKSILVSRLLMEAELVISLPKIKTHVQTVFTGAVKNFFGAIPLAERRRLHRLNKYERFSESIVDLYSLFSGGIAIMDGVVGMQGNGPSSGAPRKLGALIASRNAANLDVVACSLIGLSSGRVHTVKDTIARGMALPLDEIEVLGDPISELRTPFDIPMRLLLRANPLIERATDVILGVHSSALIVLKDRCTRCGHCQNICPVGAITIDKCCRIDYSKCIKCYCCFEVCPYDAILRKQPFLGRIVSRLLGRNRRGQGQDEGT
ncbi:MAG: DUF362 domain-containing protein [Candidatus Coatesbacteria bacterium]|nr:DUF362 domain-containing protein [Candidatus Coatesbacteria bacterium]